VGETDLIWSPEKLFLCTYIVGALSGIGALARSTEPITPRAIVAAIVFYGCSGCGLGMIGYEYLGWKNKPWLVVGCGFLVGVRAIHFEDIKAILRRMLSANGSTNTEK
jgi:hypothetical protein